MKIILLLRDPVDRMISDYNHEMRFGRIPGNPSFEDYVLNSTTGKLNSDLWMFELGHYINHLKEWFQYFPRNQFLILDTNDLIHNPVTILRRVEDFLHVPNQITKENFVYVESKGFYCKRKTPKDDLSCLKQKGHKHKKPSEKIIAKLRQHYKPHNKMLYELIHEKFSWMN